MLKLTKDTIKRTPWQKRLAKMATTGQTIWHKTCPARGHSSEETVYRGENDEAELVVTVEYEWEPAQNGGMTDPSWDAYASVTNAYLYVEGKGWREFELTEHECDKFASSYTDSMESNDCGYDDSEYDDRDYYDDRW